MIVLECWRPKIQIITATPDWLVLIHSGSDLLVDENIQVLQTQGLSSLSYLHQRVPQA